MTAYTIYHALLRFETASSSPPDARRVISSERQVLHVAIDRVARLERAIPGADNRSGADPAAALDAERTEARAHLSDVTAEARRVALMWDVPGVR